MKEKFNKENPQKEMKRREFIRATATFAAGAGVLGLGSYKAFGVGNDSVAQNTIENVSLNNGVQMPILGFGTLYLNGETGAQCVADAISLGYRLIDTATIYGNEEAVGAGIKKSGINRKELFVTSKLWVDDSGYEKAKVAFQTSLDKLGLDYLDLYLIHRPRGDVKGSWKAMEELHKAGKIKAIGISNFEDHQIDELLEYATIKPAVNQIETHAFFQQSKARKSLLDYGVQMEAWSPLAQGRNGLFTNETLAAIGKKYNKNNAQVSLRWHYQRGIVAIPRSSQKAHMMENLNIFDFELDDADMKTIAALDLDKTQFPEWE
ncbi:aldo/keto reductase [uncultured Draconibacterium sp.]|uniref:aldo/keto reductase n=1 Tax=uncultured Draconibacterium sp. TaxID=1573823 RepID=UPI0029C6062D|nr:aldo/keto reductase [uncultured Draconibacterium sp.]